MTQLALPAELQKLAGRMLDVDTHEMMPAQHWIREFGPVVKELTECFLNNGETALQDPNHPNIPGFRGDNLPIDPETIWQQKGGGAPGAVDPSRRLGVMDVMGVARQLMFPTGVGMFGLAFAIIPQENLYKSLSSIQGDRRKMGRAMLKAYNEWGIRASHVSDRVRPVLPLLADTLPELMDGARYLLDNGVRAIWLPSSVLPGGRSPAHPDLDQFWRLFTDAKAVACLHIDGGASSFLHTPEWGNAPAFENFRILGEFRVDPWALSIQHLPTQNFLAAMVVGGVFERHPDLRVGAIETGAGWIGPLMQNLDTWHMMGKKAFGTATSIQLPKMPSHYIRRNVRVSAFDFEPIDKYIEWYGLEDVLCFATDYPHVEGGKEPAKRFYDRIKRLGAETVEKFFVTNGEWLLPA